MPAERLSTRQVFEAFRLTFDHGWIFPGVAGADRRASRIAHVKMRALSPESPSVPIPVSDMRLGARRVSLTRR